MVARVTPMDETTKLISCTNVGAPTRCLRAKSMHPPKSAIIYDPLFEYTRKSIFILQFNLMDRSNHHKTHRALLLVVLHRFGSGFLGTLWFHPNAEQTLDVRIGTREHVSRPISSRILFASVSSASKQRPDAWHVAPLSGQVQASAAVGRHGGVECLGGHASEQRDHLGVTGSARQMQWRSTHLELVGGVGELVEVRVNRMVMHLIDRGKELGVTDWIARACMLS